MSGSKASPTVPVVLDVVLKPMNHLACLRFETEVRKCFDVGLILSKMF